MQKDFDTWNSIKKNINLKNRRIFCNQREIWWCSIGLNIGSEEDGKNELFERPVLIVDVFNQDMLRVLPLTSKDKQDRFHVKIIYNNKFGSVIISQMKTISTRRLSRKLCRLDKIQFDKVKGVIRESFL